MSKREFVEWAVINVTMIAATISGVLLYVFRTVG